MNTPDRPNNDGVNPPSQPVNKGPTPINNSAQKQFLQSIIEIRRDWSTYLELYAHQARITFAKYEAAKDAGFSDQQALDICTKSWI